MSIKKTFVLGVSLLILGLGFAFAGVQSQDTMASLSQNGQGGNGSGNGPGKGSGTGDSSYDINTETTVIGEVISFYSVNGYASNPKNPIILLEDSTELIVQTGPSWFMDNQEFSIKLNDIIIVIGSLITSANGNSGILAREITSSGVTLVLRDELGYPVWKGTRGQGSSERNPNSYMNIVYDITLETTVSANVESVTVASCIPGTYPGYQMIVTLEDGSSLNVMLAPFWYLTNQEFSIENGTEVALTGIYYTREDGGEIFVLRVLETDEFKLILRDETGLPMWQAFRGGNI